MGRFEKGIDQSIYEKEKDGYSLKVLLLVGGKGTRLESVTGGAVSKGLVNIDSDGRVRGVDFMSQMFNSLGIKHEDVSLCAKHMHEQYRDFANMTGYHLLLQNGETGTAGAVEEAINKWGLNHQYLTLSVDTYLAKADVQEMIKSHRPGQISWGISRDTVQFMEAYYGLVVADSTAAIWGDTKLAWWKNWDLAGSNLYVKGAVNIIDPKIFFEAVDMFKRFCQKDYPLDLYWQILPMLEEVNRRRIERDKKSILQAVVFDNPIIDFGTPERLEFVRSIYDPKMLD